MAPLFDIKYSGLNRPEYTKFDTNTDPELVKNLYDAQYNNYSEGLSVGLNGFTGDKSDGWVNLIPGGREQALGETPKRTWGAIG